MISLTKMIETKFKDNGHLFCIRSCYNSVLGKKINTPIKMAKKMNML